MSVNLSASEWDALQQQMDAEVGITNQPNEFGQVPVLDPFNDPLLDPLRDNNDVSNWMQGVNLNSSLVGNIFQMVKDEAKANDFDLGVFEGIDIHQSLLSNLWDMSLEHADHQAAPSEATNAPKSFTPSVGTATDAGEIAPSATGEANIAASESPVVAQTQNAAAAGIDLNAAGIANGSIPEAAGLDVLPDMTSLLDLAAALII
jgi:hypothetical protein